MVTPRIQPTLVFRWFKGGASIVNILSYVIGALTGILSGLGIGGGSLLVLYLTTVAGMTPQQAGGINLLYFIGCAPAALIGHIKRGLVDIKVATICIVGGSIATIPISLLRPHMDAHLLRRLFGFLILYVAYREWRRGSNSV